MSSSKIVQFTVRGQRLSLTREQVVDGLKKTDPGLIQKHKVEINGTSYPVKQAFSAVTNLDLLDFQTAEARRIFEKLGFKVGRV